MRNLDGGVELCGRAVGAAANPLRLDTTKHLFFTNEIFLPAIAQPQPWEAVKAQYRLGTGTYMDTVLDRWKFYHFLTSRRLAEVPRTLRSTEDPRAAFGDRFRIRVWRSWEGALKLPRGMNVTSEEHWRKWQHVLQTSGLEVNQWGYQELLGILPQDNVSVSGWHDRDFRVYFVTRKVVQTEENGRVVERIPDPENLCGATRRVLEALEFDGPFELEFIRDPRTGSFKVLELNPRFWMQHRLAGALSGNALVRRYLGWPVQPVDGAGWGSPMYWLDSDAVFSRFLSVRGFGIGRYFVRAVWGQPWSVSLKHTSRRVLSHALKRFSLGERPASARSGGPSPGA